MSLNCRLRLEASDRNIRPFPTFKHRMAPIRFTSPHSCLAIVPAYNEAGSVGPVIHALHEHVPDFDVLVVDDGSTDRTDAVARDAGAEVLRMPFNLGIGGAMQAGYRYAHENNYDFAMQVDGDGQHDPQQIDRLVEVFRANHSVDLVYGSRFAEESGYEASIARRAGIRFFASLLSMIMHKRVTDPTSGFRLANRRAISLFARDYPHDYPEVEAILLAHSHRLQLIEVPVHMRPRASGQSSITTLRSSYYMAKVLLAVLIGLVRARPTVCAGGPAVSAERSI
jgi:glycosyltransferase involved in cell wall biosynthesis